MEKGKENGGLNSGLQLLLRDMGFYKGEINGVFDAKVESAVKALQRKYGVSQDGKIGANTAELIQNYYSKPAKGETAERTQVESEVYQEVTENLQGILNKDLNVPNTVANGPTQKDTFSADAPPDGGYPTDEAIERIDLPPPSNPNPSNVRGKVSGPQTSQGVVDGWEAATSNAEPPKSGVAFKMVNGPNAEGAPSVDYKPSVPRRDADSLIGGGTPLDPASERSRSLLQKILGTNNPDSNGGNLTGSADPSTGPIQQDQTGGSVKNLFGYDPTKQDDFALSSADSNRFQQGQSRLADFTQEGGGRGVYDPETGGVNYNSLSDLYGDIIGLNKVQDAISSAWKNIKDAVSQPQNGNTDTAIAAQKVADAQAALDLADARNIATSWSNPLDKFRAAFDSAQKEKELENAKAEFDRVSAIENQALANRVQDAQQDYRSQFLDLEPTTVGLTRGFLNQTKMDAENALQNAQNVINGKTASIVSPDTNRELRSVDNPVEKAYLDAQNNLNSAKNSLQNAENRLNEAGNGNPKTPDIWAVQDARQTEIDAQKKFDEAKANYAKTFEEYQKQFNEPEPTTLPDKLEGFANSAKKISNAGKNVENVDIVECDQSGKNCNVKNIETAETRQLPDGSKKIIYIPKGGQVTPKDKNEAAAVGAETKAQPKAGKALFKRSDVKPKLVNGKVDWQAGNPKASEVKPDLTRPGAGVETAK